MTRLIVAALVAGLLAGSAGAAFAQAGAEPAPAAEDANAPSVAVEGGAPVELDAAEDQTKVSVVMLSALPEGETPLELTEDADELAALHASIEDNTAIKTKLDAVGHTINEVVGTANNVDGSIVVYVDDRG